MPGEVYYGCKRFFARVGILATMLAFVGLFVYAYILPTVSPEVFTNPKRIVESQERQRAYEITDEFIGTYAYVSLRSELLWTGSEEWLRSAQATLEADKVSFSRLDPLRTEGQVAKAYDDLVTLEIHMLRQYADLLGRELPPDVADSGIGNCDNQWNQLFVYYDAFKAADAEYQAQFDSAL